MKYGIVVFSSFAWLAACEPGSFTAPTSHNTFTTVNQHTDFTGTFTNECPPAEDVLFSGRLHILTGANANASRMFINWADVKGVGVTSGDRYAVQDNFKDEQVTSQAGIVEDAREHLRMIRQGSPDNLQAFVHLIFNTDGTVDVVEFRIECRG